MGNDSSIDGWVVSVDDHVIEPPGLWVDRVAARFREQAPQVVVRDGVDTWVFENGRQISIVDEFVACAGKDPGQYRQGPINYADMRPGFYDPVARVQDMDLDGVLASVCFPTVSRIGGQMFLAAYDKELSLACLKAYNDWVVDEWAGAVPGRLIPCALLPYWDPNCCAEEVERVAEKGAKAVSWTESLFDLGLPSLHDRSGHWDRVLAALNDTGLVLSCHFGSSGRVHTTSPDAPRMVSATLVAMNLASAMTDWIWSGKLQRYPNIRIVLAEGGIGWLPYVLERLSSVYERYRFAKDNELAIDLMTGVITPREMDAMSIDEPLALFHDHIFACFIDDPHGSENIDKIGVDNVMIETDYPHSDGTFPHSRDNALRMTAHLPPETREKVLRDNALRVFDFAAATPVGA
jgi:predicted TIM-barrel fold metal-dependent hydrolase